MPGNYLVTGPPRSGKTTAIERAVDDLAERGVEIGGLVAPELREDGRRVGFELVDLATGERRVLAHVDRDSGPSVGKYRVDVDAVDELSERAFERALNADVAVVDEVAPMEVHSEAFCDGVRRVLDSAVPLVAAVHHGSTTGFVGAVKERDDVETLEVDAETRDELPGRLVERVLEF